MWDLTGSSQRAFVIFVPRHVCAINSRSTPAQIIRVHAIICLSKVMYVHPMHKHCMHAKLFNFDKNSWLRERFDSIFNLREFLF